MFENKLGTFPKKMKRILKTKIENCAVTINSYYIVIFYTGT